MLETLLSFEPSHLISFILAGLLLNITPGVDFLFVAASGINGGAHVGRAAAVGINLGMLVHIALATLGVSTLLVTYPAAYHGIRLAGAIYLLYLAYHAWKTTRLADENDAALTVPVAIARGFMTNVLNPKTALFIFAFIPQFTDPANGPLSQQILVLGLIFFINGFIFVLILGTTAGHLSPLLRRHLPLLNKITAVLFALLALRIIFPLLR